MTLVLFNSDFEGVISLLIRQQNSQSLHTFIHTHSFTHTNNLHSFRNTRIGTESHLHRLKKEEESHFCVCTVQCTRCYLHSIRITTGHPEGLESTKEMICINSENSLINSQRSWASKNTKIGTNVRNKFQFIEFIVQMVL
jgi:hypothetical protein